MKSSSNQPDQYVGVITRLETLREEIESSTGRNRRRQRAFLIAGVVLIALSMVGLGSLTSKTMQLDAHAVAQLGRQQLELHMPGEVDSLERYLASNAPTLVSSFFRSALRLVPQLRTSLVRDLDERSEKLTAVYEAKFEKLMLDVVQQSKATVDALGADRTDAEKLEMLVAHVGEEFRKASTVAFNELYPEYTREFDRVKEFLRGLQNKDVNELSKRERLQKELIETLLRLMIVEGVKTH